jgi:hypothetical protein
MLYTVRCASGKKEHVVGFRGALLELAQCGPDAAVFSIFGKWLAGRVVAA